MKQDAALGLWLKANLPLIREEYRKGQRGNWQCTAHWDREVCTEAWRAAVKHTLAFVAEEYRRRGDDDTAEFVMKLEP